MTEFKQQMDLAQAEGIVQESCATRTVWRRVRATYNDAEIKDLASSGVCVS